MELYEVKIRLKEILTEFNGYGNFTIHTMSEVEIRAREVKPLAIKILGEEDEVAAEIDAVILISKNYHRKHLGLDYEIIKEAIMHLEYGVDLFLQKI